MNATARLMTTVARRMTGNIIPSTSLPRRPLNGTIANRALTVCASRSISSSATSLSCFLTSNRASGSAQLQQPKDCDDQRRFRSNRSRRGLYDGKDIRSGNNLSFSMKHTKRKFKPNVFIKRIYSEILDEMVRFHLTTSTLRSIDKCGGLDNYLLTSKHVVSGEGLKTKKRVINRLKYRERKARQQQINTNAGGNEA